MANITMTEDILNKGMSKKGSWNFDQMDILGAGNPPTKGWKRAVIGLEYNEKIIELFYKLQNLKPKQRIKYKAEVKEYAAHSRKRLNAWKSGNTKTLEAFHDISTVPEKIQKDEIKIVQQFIEMSKDEAELYDCFRELCLNNRESPTCVIMSWIRTFIERHQANLTESNECKNSP